MQSNPAPGDADAHAHLRTDKTERQLPRLPRIIRAEANFLRLPLFALSTKGLRSLDGIECKGTVTRNGQHHAFTLRATRNAASYYPGPRSRAAHLAFLSIATERGFPLSNPILWTWRDLCRRMQILPSGKTVVELKTAIRATARLSIETEHAIYSKADGETICTREQELHLYEQVEFLGGKLPDGTRSDQNRLWLSDWYLTNLNALFTAPLDYDLWRSLDERSPIASRMYEFLLLAFYSGSPFLRINYRTLAQFLPIVPERYRSSAMQQLSPALKRLTDDGLLSAVNWLTSRDGQPQLQLFRGSKLGGSSSRPAALDFAHDLDATIDVTELRNLKRAESTIVNEFYRLWTNQPPPRLSNKELVRATDLVAIHGEAKLKQLLPLAVKRMKVKFPDAKTFGALERYIPDALLELERQQRHQARLREAETSEQRHRQEAAKTAKENAALKQVWDTLAAPDQQDIRQAVLTRHASLHLERYPATLERFCLEEVAHRQRPHSPN